MTAPRGLRGEATLALGAAFSAGCGAPTPGAPTEGPGPAPPALCGWSGAACAPPAGAAVEALSEAPVLIAKTNPPADETGPVWTLRGTAPFSVMLNLCESSDPDQVINPDGTQDPSGDQINWQFNFGEPPDYRIDADGTPLPDPAVGAGGAFRADFGGFCRVEHTYREPGTYIATVSVTDKHLEDQAHDVSALARKVQRVRIVADQSAGREKCFYNSSRDLSAGLVGPPNVLGNIEFYFGDDKCLGTGLRLDNSALIFAWSEAEARAICQGLGTLLFVGRIADVGFDAPPGFFGCEVI